MAGQIEGLPQTLRELGKVDPKLRRQLAKSIRTAASPLQSAARAKYPGNPLSNWTTGRYGYNQGKAAGGVKVKIGGRASGGGTSLGGLIGTNATIPLVTMVQSNAGGAVFDMAGRSSGGSSPQGAAFIAGLNRHGSASRTMWPAAEEKLPEVSKACEHAVEVVSREANARLAAGI